MNRSTVKDLLVAQERCGFRFHLMLLLPFGPLTVQADNPSLPAARSQAETHTTSRRRAERKIAREPVAAEASTRTKRLLCKPMRPDWTTRIRIVGVGPSHFSTRKRRDFSAMFTLISFHFGLTAHAGGLVSSRMPRLVNRPAYTEQTTAVSVLFPSRNFW